MKKELIKLHKECLSKGFMPYAGLCCTFLYNINSECVELFNKIFSPTIEDNIELFKNSENISFWGFGRTTKLTSYKDIVHKYTSRRQTLMLLFIEVCEENWD